MKLASRYVNKVSEMLILQTGLCIHYELLNFATNFRSSEHFSEK